VRTDGPVLQVGQRFRLTGPIDRYPYFVAEKGMTEDLAYLLITVKADLEVCQVVNGLRTARVCIDRDFYEKLPPA
jgi:acetamidase/formamidase